jgi:hypothetical protein
VSTDDPAMFGTDLAADYEAARQLGVSARDCYLAGLRGALCDRPTRDALQRAGEAFDWAVPSRRPEVLGERASGPARAGRPGRDDQARSNRSRFITLFHAATKSRTNFSFASSLA